MRLIDADALIKFIDNRYDITWKDDYEGGIKDACTDILEEINKMPTIEERKWIPCTERLPEWWWEEDEEVWNAKPVIVCGTDLDYPYSGMAVGLYGPDGWVIEDDNFSSTDTPVAWMPLPEPYKGGNDES